MNTMNRTALLALAFTLPALSACNKNQQADAAALEKVVCEKCGVIETIEPREVKGEASALGTIAGAVAGGVIGHQFGSGRGNDAATVAGAAGGAFAGREVEKEARAHVVYDISIRMDNGQVRRLTKNTSESLRPGDHVEVTGSQITRTS